MLVARTQAGHASLKAQFQNHTITKQYEAIVYGTMKQDSYTVESPIGRAKTFGRWTAIPKAVRGTTREARTDFHVIARYHLGTHSYSHVRAIPHTGRTHQIRVHLQYLNHPIVADPLYAGKRNTPEANVGFERQALHAAHISFVDGAGEEQEVSALLPDDWRSVCDQLQTPTTPNKVAGVFKQQAPGKQ
jgi:23S rRNA pseudouridine1911/1915/1917 synthase